MAKKDDGVPEPFRRAFVAESQADMADIVLEDHPQAVNSDDDGVHSGWVRCGAYRFKAAYGEHEATKVEFTRGAGKDWQPLEITKLG